jgi:hypothetical protein
VRLQLEPLPGDVVHLLLRGATQLEPSAHIRRKLRERLVPLIPDRVGPRTLALAPWGGLKDLAMGVTHSRFLIGVASFALGIGTASALRPSRPSPAEPRASAVAPVSGVAPASLLESGLPVVAPASSPRRPSPAHRAPASRVSTVSVTAVGHTTPPQPPPSRPVLQFEGELLEKGRIAMVRGDADGAFAVVDEHFARFPHGALAEEREALRIQALVAADRNPEARAALGAFQRTYPRSLVGPALDAAVGLTLR